MIIYHVTHINRQKSISKYDEEFLVATLSSIHTDAKLLQQKHNISAHKFTKLYHDNECAIQNSTNHTEQLLNIDYAKPKSKQKLICHSLCKILT